MKPDTLRPRKSSIAAATRFALIVVLSFAANWHAPLRAEVLTRADVTAPGGLIWDTRPGFGITLFFKKDGAFLNPNDQALNIDLTVPGSYTFDLRLNKGGDREMTGYMLALFFEGSGSPDIFVSGTRDTTGSTPPFSGDLTYTGANNIITLTALRISSFNPVDEVAEFTATPDGAIDYVGSITLTVEQIPEPAAVLLLGLGTCLLWLQRRRNV